jgi:hypothetical protein
MGIEAQGFKENGIAVVGVSCLSAAGGLLIRAWPVSISHTPAASSLTGRREISGGVRQPVAALLPHGAPLAVSLLPLLKRNALVSRAFSRASCAGQRTQTSHWKVGERTPSRIGTARPAAERFASAGHPNSDSAAQCLRPCKTFAKLGA